MANKITFLKYYEVLCFKLDLKLSNSSFLENCQVYASNMRFFFFQVRFGKMTKAEG